MTGNNVLTKTEYLMAGLHLHSYMKEFPFVVAVEVEAKNKESAKNKIVGWLEPSLALKKNESIILKKVTVSKTKDAEDTTPDTSDLEEPEKEEVPEGDEEWDDSWVEEPWDEPETDETTSDFEWEDEDEEVPNEPSIEEAVVEPEVDVFGLSGLKKSDDDDGDDGDGDDDDDDDDWDDDEW